VSGPAARAARQAQDALARRADPALSQAGRDLLVSLADERRLVDLAADRLKQLVVGHRADRAGRRRTTGAWSSEVLRRRRCSHAADLETPHPADPGQRQLQPSCDVSASAGEGGDRSPR
jgi:hypothetical protein